MSFETSVYLRKATSRAKSDVANKLVSMFLHEVSRKLAAVLKMSVTDPNYAEAVSLSFGSNCCYCKRPLENDRASVEHLEGMNRFRMGLHIPGNVIVSCKRCNGEKRRDDQLPTLILGETGWKSFLSHDLTRCPANCKTCQYWQGVWSDKEIRIKKMDEARNSISAFIAKYPEAKRLSAKVRVSLHNHLEALYREGQDFASNRIKRSVDEVLQDMEQHLK